MGDANAVRDKHISTRRFFSFASFFVGVTTYALLPESVRPLTRLSLSLHAILIALIASNLVLPNTTLAATPWWRMRVPLLIALNSYF